MVRIAKNFTALEGKLLGALMIADKASTLSLTHTTPPPKSGI